MYNVIIKRSLEEVANELNKRGVDKDNIIYIHKGEDEVNYKVLYYEQQLEN